MGSLDDLDGVAGEDVPAAGFVARGGFHEAFGYGLVLEDVG